MIQILHLKHHVNLTHSQLFCIYCITKINLLFFLYFVSIISVVVIITVNIISIIIVIIIIIIIVVIIITISINYDITITIIIIIFIIIMMRNLIVFFQIASLTPGKSGDFSGADEVFPNSVGKHFHFHSFQLYNCYIFTACHPKHYTEYLVIGMPVSMPTLTIQYCVIVEAPFQ